MQRKGIILAGGSGTRLYPITQAVSKQLVPVYDKPMIYYPLSVLMLAGIREIAVITTPEDQAQFQRLMGDGSQWGLELTWIIQQKPEGLAQAYLLAEEFLDGAPSAMILGDNIFYGHGFSGLLNEVSQNLESATVMGHHVHDPSQYGVVEFDGYGKAISIEEKPTKPRSNYAITGLYFFDHSAPERAKKIRPSRRGELEITCLMQSYLDDGLLEVKKMSRGFAWFDTGTHNSLLDAANFVRTLEARQGETIACLEEIAFNRGWIGLEEIEIAASRYAKNNYGTSLKEITDASSANRQRPDLVAI